MKVHSITIDNCKSYKNRESFSLEDDITLLVGPNAGGKSNTMDILSIVLRKYFLQSYTIYEGEDAGIRVQDIHKHELFHPISDWLDKNSERAEQPQRIELVLEVGATDVDNIKTILNNKEKFIGALKKYRNRRTDKLEFLNSWDTEMFVVGNKVKFTIQDHEIVCSSDLGDKFREYLQYLNLFILLARDLDNVILAPTFLYFSPYRSAGTEDLNVTLASDNYINLLHQYFQTTSRGTTSLIKLATVFFAEKKRRMEERASKNGYGKAWDEDEDVSLTKKYLKHLGYGWDLKLVDGNKNIYEIELLRNGRKFSISKASSGEKEILNFLFGIFALRTRGGLLIIDEPELHLHPRWQAVLLDLFQELSRSTENQFLLTTHSPVFITPETISNLRRVAKDDDGSTRIISFTDDSQSPKSLLHIVNSHNNERVFFADKVILVEGIQDRIVFEEFIKRYREAANISAVIEVLEVHGKTNFDRYCKFLETLRVPRYIIGDLDYGLDLKMSELKNLMEIPFKKVDEKVFNDKKSKDRRTLTEALRDAIQTEDISKLKEIYEYIVGRFKRIKKNLPDSEIKQLQRSLQELWEQGILILIRGEIEDYLPSQGRLLDDTIKLMEPHRLLTWLKNINGNQELEELESIVGHILEIQSEDLEDIRDKVLQQLKNDDLSFREKDDDSHSDHMEIEANGSVGTL